MDGKFQKVEEGGRTSLIKGVPRLKGDLKALRNLTEEENTSRWKLREKRQVVAYLLGYASRLGC